MFYTRYVLFLTLVLLVYSLSSRDILQEKAASVNGIITDFEQNPKVGEIILFENSATKKIFRTVSNEEGQFKMELPYSQTYLIKIKGIGSELDYTEMQIPALEEDQESLSFEIEIQVELPKIYTLNNVYFESGKASIMKSSFAELEELLEYLKYKKNTVIEIAGHTDNVGDPKANLLLSQKRAESVRDYLISDGINPERVIAKGYGEVQPVATNETPMGRGSNRRTEVRILNE